MSIRPGYIYYILFIVFSLSISNRLNAQQDFYEFGQVREIRIYFEDDNWKYILDSLFSSGDNYSRIKADVVIDGEIYPGCGVRYKGFSSWNSDETKNPFNIRLDYSYENQNHLGYKKLKLSNVIYDPSFIREALSYKIARSYFPASGANYANLYIEDELIGLYSNVEAVDECFVEKHYNSDDNPFFKGNPETLSYPFGQNANLAYSHGDDTTDYMPYYKLESDYGWTELLNLIYVLNNDTASISEVLNVDQTLWMHAFNYTLLNLDSYIAYAQNYYLYMDDNEIFNPIIWDLNMSFGSFRHSDGSLNFSGLTIDEMGELDPLQHLEFSISPRPLMKNLFLNSTYKKMYLAHIRTIMEEEILSGNYMHDAEFLHEIIEPHVIADTNKFYSDEDFQNNIYTEVGESTELYPGLEEIMTARTDYLLTYTGITGEPEYGNKTISQDYAYPGDEIEFHIELENADKVYLYYRFYKSNQFKVMYMTDDGSGADTISGDNVYAASLLTNGDVVEYYFWAENDSAGAFLPQKAGVDYFEIVCYNKQEVLINEIKYLNDNYPSNLIGFDWVELYNPSGNVKDLINYKLYYNNTMYLLEDSQIDTYGYLTLSIVDYYFLDSTCFNELQEYLILTDYHNNIIDSLNIIPCNTQSSYGSYPDGSSVVQILNPTYGTSNKLFGNGLADLHIYPNPCAEEVNFELNSDFQVNEIRICNHLGSLVYYINDLSDVLIENNEKISLSLNLNISDWSNGIYYLRYIGDKQEYSAKFVKIK